MTCTAPSVSAGTPPLVGSPALLPECPSVSSRCSGADCKTADGAPPPSPPLSRDVGSQTAPVGGWVGLPCYGGVAGVALPGASCLPLPPPPPSGLTLGVVAPRWDRNAAWVPPCVAPLGRCRRSALRSGHEGDGEVEDLADQPRGSTSCDQSLGGAEDGTEAEDNPLHGTAVWIPPSTPEQHLAMEQFLEEVYGGGGASEVPEEEALQLLYRHRFRVSSAQEELSGLRMRCRQRSEGWPAALRTAYREAFHRYGKDIPRLSLVLERPMAEVVDFYYKTKKKPFMVPSTGKAPAHCAKGLTPSAARPPPPVRRNTSVPACVAFHEPWCHHRRIPVSALSFGDKGALGGWESDEGLPASLEVGLCRTPSSSSSGGESTESSSSSGGKPFKLPPRGPVCFSATRSQRCSSGLALKRQKISPWFPREVPPTRGDHYPADHPREARWGGTSDSEEEEATGLLAPRLVPAAHSSSLALWGSPGEPGLRKTAAGARRWHDMHPLFL
eukprot:RCo016125